MDSQYLSNSSLRHPGKITQAKNICWVKGEKQRFYWFLLTLQMMKIFQILFKRLSKKLTNHLKIIYKVYQSTLCNQQVLDITCRNPCEKMLMLWYRGSFISYFLEFPLTSWRKEKQVHIVDLHHISIFYRIFQKVVFKTIADLQTCSFPFSDFLANLHQT